MTRYRGLTLLVSGVTAWELASCRRGFPPLTAEFRALPFWLTAPVVACTVAHLFGWLPANVDPFHHVARLMSPTGG